MVRVVGTREMVVTRAVLKAEGCTVGSRLTIRASSLSSRWVKRRGRPVDVLGVMSPVASYCSRSRMMVLRSTPSKEAIFVLDTFSL